MLSFEPGADQISTKLSEMKEKSLGCILGKLNSSDNERIRSYGDLNIIIKLKNLDEKTCQSYPNGKVRMWRYDGERFERDLIVNKTKSGRFSCNFHGFMSGQGLGELTLIDGYLNSDKYCDILETVVFPSMDFLKPEFNPYFMHNR